MGILRYNAYNKLLGRRQFKLLLKSIPYPIPLIQ